MSQQTLKIRIIDRQAGGAGLDCEIAGAVEFGRQRQNEPDPPARLDASDAQRVIVAPLLDVSIPRIWFRVEPVALGSCKLINLSGRLAVPVSHQPPVDGTNYRTFDLPLTISVPRFDIRISDSRQESSTPSAVGLDMEGLTEKKMDHWRNDDLL